MEDVKLFDDNSVYTVPEVAKLLKMSRDNLYRYIKMGKLKAIRIAGQRSIRLLGKDINEFLAMGYVQETAK